MLQLRPISGLLLGRLAIRKAVPEDAIACDRIARQHKTALGWVMLQTIQRAIEDGTLHVATIDGVIRAFALYSVPSRGTNKGWNVVHTLATERGWQGMNIGRNLLYSVPTPIRLKCPSDLPANKFYSQAGFQFAGLDHAKSGRVLNVWELRVLCIHVQGNNRKIPHVAYHSGMAYGSRHDDQKRDYCTMIDIYWEDYNWQDYVNQILNYKPTMAMVADYERPEQKSVMLAQVEALEKAGVLTVMVCPKFHGAIKDIPPTCRIAVSVPSSYAGFLPNPDELRGRTVHLLGGSCIKQRKLITEYCGYGVKVLSVDGNNHQKDALYGRIFSESKIQKSTTSSKNNWVLNAIISGRNIVKLINNADAHLQLSFLDSTGEMQCALES
ncbi:MAG: GNAT family N-acetyltransferase [Caulobacteraceae bacterium]|nr:GNAT family N-acetyltransferase [Caulobacteraceae bacterium]